ncbi:MAG: hypothetical protein J6R21_01570, partial [Bacteroidales bacterium]|nr:hypothetical protein [Bacteroidales bacterium]
MKRLVIAFAFLFSLNVQAQEIKEVEIEGMMFQSMTQSDVSVAVNVQKINELGKYYALNMQWVNASGAPIQIDSYDDINMTIVQGNGRDAQEVPVKLLTREGYLQAIEARLQKTRRMSALASTLSVAETAANPESDVLDVLIDVKAEAKEQENLNEMLAYEDDELTQGYLTPCVLAAGETKLGYLMFERQ